MNQPVPLYLRIIFTIVSVAILIAVFAFLGVFVFVLFGVGLIASAWRLLASRSSKSNPTVEPMNPNYYEPENDHYQASPSPVIEIEGKVIK
ncbi:MAG: hypothetical protein AAF518_22850 [Spirochaetota bacterium]